MKTQRSVTIFLFCFLSPIFAFSQVQIDTAFDRTINASWHVVREYLNSGKRDSNLVDPQIAFSKQFMQYYSAHQNTKTGRKAVQSAFMMLANRHDLDALHEALLQIRTDSDAWPLLLNSISIAYGIKKWNEYSMFLDSLSTKLTHPKSLAEIYLIKGRECLAKLDDSDARQYFHKILSLAADSSQLATAAAGLYETDSLSIGNIAPDFTATSLRGEEIQLSALKGHNVLLEFTGTWCGPCLHELPNLKSAYSKYSQQGFTFISISQDDSANTVIRFAAQHDIPWPQILAPQYLQDPICARYRADAIPKIFLIDKQGKIFAKYIRGEAIEKAIQQLLAKQ